MLGLLVGNHIFEKPSMTAAEIWSVMKPYVRHLELSSDTIDSIESIACRNLCGLPEDNVKYIEEVAVQLNTKGYHTKIEFVNGETIVNQHIKTLFQQKRKFEEKAKAEKRKGLQAIPADVQPDPFNIAWKAS